MSGNEQIVLKLIRMNSEKERQNLRSFSRIPLDKKIKIFENQKSIFHQLKQDHGGISNTILTYAALILAIENIVISNPKIDLKALLVKQTRHRKKIKKEKILGLWAIIKALKTEQQMSFRQISQYLRKYHKLDVAHSTIFDIWNKLETKIKG